MWPFPHILGKELHSNSHWESQSMEGLWWDALSPKLAWPSFQGSQFESAWVSTAQRTGWSLSTLPEPHFSISGSRALVQMTFKATAQYGQHSSRDYKAHRDSQICSGWVTHRREHTRACPSGRVKAVYFRKTSLPLVSTLSQNQHGLDLTHQMPGRQTDRQTDRQTLRRRSCDVVGHRIFFSKRYMIHGQKKSPISSWANLETLFVFPFFGKVDTQFLSIYRGKGWTQSQKQEKLSGREVPSFLFPFPLS